MSEVIPLRPVADQQLNVTLANQPCTIRVLGTDTGLYLDLYVNSALLVGGVVCENANRLVRDAYLGFIGDLAFFDTQGQANPEVSGLGSRWMLVYLP